jgi:hypothetical protein
MTLRAAVAGDAVGQFSRNEGLDFRGIGSSFRPGGPGGPAFAALVTVATIRLALLSTGNTTAANRAAEGLRLAAGRARREGSPTACCDPALRWPVFVPIVAVVLVSSTSFSPLSTAP